MLERINYILSKPDLNNLKIKGLFKEIFFNKTAVVHLNMNNLITKHGSIDIKLKGDYIVWFNDKYHLLIAAVDGDEFHDFSDILCAKDIVSKRKGFAVITSIFVLVYCLLIALIQLI